MIHSRKQIVDDLLHLNVSRQRKYQIRKMRMGKCILCGNMAYKTTTLCYSHNIKRGIIQPGRNKQRMRKWSPGNAQQPWTYVPQFITG